MNRPSWDEYFLRIAEVVATRGTCLRLQVGAVLVLENRIMSTGYNGSLPGEPHCTEEGCQIVEGSGCTRTTHAEENAMDMGDGNALYTTHSPCELCCTLILHDERIERVVYRHEYRIVTGLDMLRGAGVECVKV